MRPIVSRKRESLAKQWWKSGKRYVIMFLTTHEKATMIPKGGQIVEVWGWIKKHIIMVLLIILGIFLVLTYTTYGRKYKEAQEMLANSGN